MQSHQKSPGWFGPVTALVIAAMVGAGVTGCGGGGSGPAIPPAPIPTSGGTPSPGRTPTPIRTPSPTPTGTMFAPSPIPTARPGNVTVFSAQGTFSRLTGQFTQDTNDQGAPIGLYYLVPLVPIPTPTPGPAPTPEPTPNNSLSLRGDYTLSNGEVGVFLLEVEPPAAGNSGTEITSSGTAIGLPRPPLGQTFDFDHPVETGVATVSVSTSGSTGSGRVTLDNGVSGTITINQRMTNNLRALHNLPQNVRVRMTTRMRR